MDESNGHDQTPAYGPGDIPARPMMYRPVRLLHDTQALLFPDDDARPTPLFYYNTSNHVPNNILNNHLWYGNINYPNASRQCFVTANGFSELSGNDRNATNMTGAPVMFHMNFSNDAFASYNPSQALQQHPQGSGIPQELQRIPLNCAQQNSFLQNSLQEDDGPRQRLLQQIVSEQREAPELRKTEQRIEPQKMKLQQNSTQDRILAQKVMRHNVPSHLPMVRPNSAQQNVTQQNLLQQNIMLQQQRTFQKKIPEQCCQPTIAFPLQSSYTCNRPQIIINPKRNDFDNISASTHAIKLKNLPPWVSKPMCFGTSGVDTQKIPETMNLYITVDNEEINRIARKNNRKTDVGSQICSVSVAKIEDNRRKRSINSVAVNAVDKRPPVGEDGKVEDNKTTHGTDESTSCDFLRNYLKKPKIDKNVNFYREFRKSDPALECDSASSATVGIFKNNEITSTTSVDEGITFKAANLNLDVRYAVNKVNNECSESNSTCVGNQDGKPETRNQFSKTRTTESQTDGEISTPSVNIVKPYNETKRRKDVEKTDNRNERTEAPTIESDKDLSSTTDTDKEMTKIDDKNDNFSTSIEAKTLNQKNIDSECVNKNKNGDKELNDMERKEWNEDQLFKKMTRHNLEMIVDDNDNHVKNVELSDFNVNLSRSDNRIDLSDRNTDTKERYVLTHVIEGNIIQESNFPFPITPSKEKICIKEKMKQGPLEAIEKCEIKSEKGCSVLSGYTPETIKTWKIHQFVAHFEELGHEETAKIFQDQELDGEALALVSQRELEAVGIEESLAKELYDFMSAVRPSYYESVEERPLL